MARLVTAGVLGAIVYYVWGMLAWMAVPLHAPTIHSLPEPVTALLKSQQLASGVYVSPFSDDPAEMRDANSNFMKQHLEGPIFSVFYRQHGSPPMNARLLVSGFLIDVAGYLLAAGLLWCASGTCRGYWSRVGFVAGLGMFVALMGHLSYWNWMYFPWGYTLAFMIDVVVGSTLAGLVIAALVPSEAAKVAEQPVKPPAPPAHSEPPPPTPPSPVRNDAISLLATLQREARFVDIVKEPLEAYSDAQVGAALRDVLRDCGVVLDRLFRIVPVVEQAEGEQIEVPGAADPTTYRIRGTTSDEATVGALVHHGWRAQQCELPQWTGSSTAAMVIAPVEVEVK